MLSVVIRILQVVPIKTALPDSNFYFLIFLILINFSILIIIITMNCEAKIMPAEILSLVTKHVIQFLFLNHLGCKF